MVYRRRACRSFWLSCSPAGCQPTPGCAWSIPSRRAGAASDRRARKRQPRWPVHRAAALRSRCQPGAYTQQARRALEGLRENRSCSGTIRPTKAPASGTLRKLTERTGDRRERPAEQRINKGNLGGLMRFVTIGLALGLLAGRRWALPSQAGYSNEQLKIDSLEEMLRFRRRPWIRSSPRSATPSSPMSISRLWSTPGGGCRPRRKSVRTKHSAKRPPSFAAFAEQLGKIAPATHPLRRGQRRLALLGGAATDARHLPRLP